MKNHQHTHDALLQGLGSNRRTGASQTRRQQKHDMLLQFMDNATRPKPQPHKRPALLSALLSVFF